MCRYDLIKNLSKHNLLRKKKYYIQKKVIGRSYPIIMRFFVALALKTVMRNKSTTEGQQFVCAQNTPYIYDSTNATCDIRILF